MIFGGVFCVSCRWCVNRVLCNVYGCAGVVAYRVSADFVYISYVLLGAPVQESLSKRM